jgi:hypothetical protein
MNERPGLLGNPAKLIALVFAAEWLLLLGALQIFPGPRLMDAFSAGQDYRDFYGAAAKWLSHQSPYVDPRFVTPPPSVLAGAAFHSDPYPVALTSFRIATFSGALAAMLWLCWRLGLTLRNSTLAMVVTVLYAPLWAVTATGNIDSIMLIFLALAASAHTRIARGALIALSIVTKVYSAVLVVVLVRKRAWRTLVWITACCLAALLPFLRIVPQFLAAVFRRGQWMRTDNNMSPAMLFDLLFGQHHPTLWKVAYGLFWLGSLGYFLVRDREKDEGRGVTDCLPWMVAAPVLVHTYVGVILLPAFVGLVRVSQSRKLGRGEWAIGTGFLLTGLFPSVLVSVLPLSADFYSAALRFLSPLAAIGVTCMILGSCFSAGLRVDRSPHPLMENERAEPVEVRIA